MMLVNVYNRQDYLCDDFILETFIDNRALLKNFYDIHLIFTEEQI